MKIQATIISCVLSDIFKGRPYMSVCTNSPWGRGYATQSEPTKVRDVGPRFLVDGLRLTDHVQSAAAQDASVQS
jgi:hypothetical protein